MARLLVLFLIVLLPLRGWAAERMVHPVEHSQVPAPVAQVDEAGMNEDCVQHMQMGQLGPMASVHASGDEHKAHTGCQACQLCMPLAALDSPSTLAVAVGPQAVPEPRIRTMVSADPVRNTKPPIS